MEKAFYIKFRNRHFALLVQEGQSPLCVPEDDNEFTDEEAMSLHKYIQEEGFLD